MSLELKGGRERMTALSSDIILHNGKICTMEAGYFSSALAIRDGNIALVGSDSEILGTAGSKTKIIDLSGRLAVPGFIDTHIHPSMAGELITGKIDMKYYQPNSISQLLEVVMEYAQKATEGEWLTGWGYDEERLAEKRHPTKWDLDKAAPKNPVFLTQTCGHVAACNSLALAIGGIVKETPNPNQGIIDRNSEGEPTGVLRNRAQEIVKRHITSTRHAILKESLSKACERLASWGVTGIHDAWAGPSVIKAYQELLSEGKLPIRVGLMPPIANPFEGDYLKELTTLRIGTGFGNSMLRIVGAKIALDGMIRSNTAALHDPYERQSINRGLITTDVDNLKRKTKACNEAGLRICIHAEGDRGIDTALDAIEEAIEENPVKDHRHRIEHFGLCTPKQLSRVKKLGVLPSVSINFVYDIGEGYTSSLGSDRSEWVYPLKSLVDEGIRGSCNSDWPVSIGNPMIGIYSAVARKTWKGMDLGSTQKISMMDALRAYTLNGAYASFEEDVKGSIKEGKQADVVVLSEDLFKISTEDVLKVKVDMTIVGGRIVYQR